MDEIRSGMEAVRARYEGMGWSLPVAVYSDRALQDHNFLQRVLYRGRREDASTTEELPTAVAAPAQLHQPMDVAMAGSVGPITCESAPTVQDEAIQPASSAITEQSAHVDDSTPSSLRRPMPDCQDSRRSLPRPKKRKRNPQMMYMPGLWVCGLLRPFTASALVGTTGFCRVPESAHEEEAGVIARNATCTSFFREAHNTKQHDVR